MTDFEFLYAFFGLLIGLIVAELAAKFADALDEHQHRPIGLLTPMLALFVLLDITSFWLAIWAAKSLVTISWRTVFTAMTMAMIYFMAAALIFPRNMDRWGSLDEHYWRRKRFVLAGVLLVNVIVVGMELSRALPSWSDTWFFIFQLTYFGPIFALLLSGRRWLDVAMLAILIANLVLGGFDLLPSSQWSKNVNLTPSITSIR